MRHDDHLQVEIEGIRELLEGNRGDGLPRIEHVPAMVFRQIQAERPILDRRQNFVAHELNRRNPRASGRQSRRWSSSNRACTRYGIPPDSGRTPNSRSPSELCCPRTKSKESESFWKAIEAMVFLE